MSETRRPDFVPDELWQAAVATAEASGRSVTAVVNDALRNFVRRAPRRPAPVVWRAIPSLSDYRVSDRGEIQSKRTGAWCPLKGWLSGSGYMYVKVVDNSGRSRSRTAHSLIAEAFYGPRPDGLEVRHLDGVYTNNTPGNLCYGTPSENRYDSVRHGTHRSVAGRRARTVYPSGTHDLDGEALVG